MTPNNAKNAFLLAASTTLVTLGVTTIATNLLLGVVAILLGFGAFVLYEVVP